MRLLLLVLLATAGSGYGELRIVSQPGVEVIWESVSIGQTDSEGVLELSDIEPGTYELLLYKRGYWNHGTTVEVPAGRTTVSLSLERVETELLERAQEAPRKKRNATPEGLAGAPAAALRDVGPKEVTDLGGRREPDLPLDRRSAVEAGAVGLPAVQPQEQGAERPSVAEVAGAVAAAPQAPGEPTAVPRRDVATAEGLHGPVSSEGDRSFRWVWVAGGVALLMAALVLLGRRQSRQRASAEPLESSVYDLVGDVEDPGEAALPDSMLEELQRREAAIDDRATEPQEADLVIDVVDFEVIEEGTPRT